MTFFKYLFLPIKVLFQEIIDGLVVLFKCVVLGVLVGGVLTLCLIFLGFYTSHGAYMLNQPWVLTWLVIGVVIGTLWAYFTENYNIL